MNGNSSVFLSVVFFFLSFFLLQMPFHDLNYYKLKWNLLPNLVCSMMWSWNIGKCRISSLRWIWKYTSTSNEEKKTRNWRKKTNNRRAYIRMKWLVMMINMHRVINLLFSVCGLFLLSVPLSLCILSPSHSSYSHNLYLILSQPIITLYTAYYIFIWIYLTWEELNNMSSKHCTAA